MTEREIIEHLVKHFVVKNGPNAVGSQYGHLQLWWAADSVFKEPGALRNPHMMLGSATNSYAVAAMGDLMSLINAAREIVGLPQPTEEEPCKTTTPGTQEAKGRSSTS